MTNTQSVLLSEIMEIALLTYNRAAALDHILSQLAASPFRHIGITIFDNCSTDATSEICDKYREVLPRMAVIRNKKNIGEYANYLHAVERLRAEYAWILSDKDDIDFAHADEVIKAIETRSYDILYVGSRLVLRWDGPVSCSASQLVNEKSRLYGSFIVWPSLIFRSSLFSEECLVKGYRNINNLHPHFPFLNALIDKDASVYVAQYQLVTQSASNSLYCDGLLSYAAWINCCQTIKNTEVRKRSIDDATANRGFFKTVAFWIASDRKNDLDRFWIKLVDIVWGVSPVQRFKLLFLLPLMIISLPQVCIARMDPGK